MDLIKNVFYLFWIVLFFSSKQAIAQDSIFSFVNKTDGVKAVKDFSRSYKLTTATRVCDALIEARGNFSIMRPGLEISASERQVAYLDPVSKTIGLEEKAYDICISFGADSLNALAALIAHELMHYYQGHRQTGSNESKAGQEVEADYLGGFLAYLAGYKTLAILPELLKKLYREYPLQENQPGYPSLTERIKLVTQADLRFDALCHEFQLANFLAITGNYEDAIVYYKIVADSFPSREIYNNLGTFYALWGLQKSTSSPGIIFPLELDPVSRLEHTKAIPSSDGPSSAQLFQTAVGYFRQSSVLDIQYLPALINEGCALALLGDAATAEELADRSRNLAKKYGSKKSQADVLVLQGIIAYLGKTADDLQEAAKNWEAARKMGSESAEHNLSLLQKNADGQLVRPIEKYDSAQKEMIEDWNLDWNIMKFQPYLEISALPAPWQLWRFGIMRAPLEESTVLLNYKDYSAYSLFQFTGAGFSGSTAKGIKVGSKTAEIESKYGKPAAKIDSPDGQYWLYAKAQIIFEIRDGAVKRWIVYHQET